MLQPAAQALATTTISIRFIFIANSSVHSGRPG
jgi:hypothetical protein